MAPPKAKLGWAGLTNDPTGPTYVYGDPGTYDVNDAALTVSDLRRLAGLVAAATGRRFPGNSNTAAESDVRAWLTASPTCTFRPFTPRAAKVARPAPIIPAAPVEDAPVNLFDDDAPVLAPVTDTAPEPEPWGPVRPAPAAPAPAPAHALGAIGDAIVQIVDERIAQVPAPIELDTIEGMVSDMIRAAVVDLPPRRIDVTFEGVTRTLDEHTNPAFDEVLGMAACRKNVFLVGPAGTGKTHMAEQIARALGWEFMAISCGPDMGKHELVGYRDAHGNYVSTMLRKAYEGDTDMAGVLFLLDEVDRSSGAVMTAMNAILANMLAAFPDRMVRRSARFMVMASGNTYGLGPDAQYVGAQAMDAAFLDRFFSIEVDYDRTFERNAARAILGDRGGDAWCDTIELVRSNIREAGCKAICSTRTVLDGAEVIAANVMAPARVIETKVTRGLSATAIDKVMAGVR